MQEVYRVKPLGHQNEHEYITEERRLELIPTIEEIRSMGYDIVQGKQLVHQVVHQEFWYLIRKGEDKPESTEGGTTQQNALEACRVSNDTEVWLDERFLTMK